MQGMEQFRHRWNTLNPAGGLVQTSLQTKEVTNYKKVIEISIQASIYLSILYVFRQNIAFSQYQWLDMKSRL